MKTALVYDRVNKWGGAEKVLLSLNELFPAAPLYTSVINSETASWVKVFPKVISSFVQQIPFAKDNHEHFPLLMPLAFESFNFDEYDLVISVTSEAAKGIITKPKTLHICYCLTPTRYLWSHYDTYFKGQIFKGVTKPIVKYLRNWDKVAAQRPDAMIAISSEVQDRIKRYYGRDSEIIYPPVDTNKFQLDESNSIRKNKKTKSHVHEYYLVVSRLVPYKRVDLALEVFSQLGLSLVVVGSGSEESKYRSIYKNKNIIFKGFVKDEELVKLYQNAKAFVFPGEEDFGIVMVEALAAGTPVIAYNKGGAADIVKDGINGILFSEQTVSSLKSAIDRFEKMKIDILETTKSVNLFYKDIFKNKFGEIIKKLNK